MSKKITLLLTIVLFVSIMNGCLTCAYADSNRQVMAVDYLYDRNGATRDGSVPTDTINLTIDSDHKYIASFPSVQMYTYTNYKLCTGDNAKRFKAVLNAKCFSIDYPNTPVEGVIYVEVYNSSGQKVTYWRTGAASSTLQMTRYYTPSSGSDYYYFKIILDDCVGYTTGTMTISLADK